MGFVHGVRYAVIIIIVIYFLGFQFNWFHLLALADFVLGYCVKFFEELNFLETNIPLYFGFQDDRQFIYVCPLQPGQGFMVTCY